MMPIDRLRFVERVAVLKQGAKAASLERRPDAVVFTYDEAYRRSGGPPVATTLPLREDPVVTNAPGALPPFFWACFQKGDA